ncbi:MAG: hypothetical protein HC929_02375 [Leptolyngbyaceae cyanobacterium SM2_5_2]|nr:hypothetical protein [Leptolyngbyaceae cyanobacterium SM2_5_2]
MASLTSLQATLQAEIGAVLTAMDPAFCSAKSWQGSLRLGRSRTTISYIYGLPSHASGLPEYSQAQAMLDSWHNPQIRATEPWSALIRAYTSAQALPSGQILFYPGSVALGGWLWLLTKAQTVDTPDLCHSLKPLFPQKCAPLAERLQLSPLALVQYTHARCSQLVRLHSEQSITLHPPNTSRPDEWPDLPWLSQLPPTTERGNGVVRGLLKLVDQTAVPLPGDRTQLEKSLSQNFVVGYKLCEAMDAWLGGNT